MNGSPAKMGRIQGTAGHSSALKMKMEEDAAAKMKKEAAMKMKKEAAMKMKKESPMDFNAKLKQASADGKLSGEFKKAVDSSPNKQKSDPYAEAKKKDPKLDEYIKIQKSTKPGSKEYEDNQALINKAYGKERDQKLKKAQIKNVKKQEVKDKETAKNATERAKDEKGNTKKRDSIVKDENKDGNMLTRALNRLKKGVKVKKASSDKQKQRKADREEAKKQGISVYQLKKNRKK